MNIRDVISYINSQPEKRSLNELRQVVEEDFQKLGIQDMGSFAKGGRYDVKKTIKIPEDLNGKMRSVQAYEKRGGYGLIITTPYDNKKRLEDYCFMPLQGMSYLFLLIIALQLDEKLNKKPSRKKTAKRSNP